MSSSRPKKSQIALVIPLSIFGIALLVLTAVYLPHLRRWRIPQAGMFPTYAAGAHIVAWKSPYATIADVRRGDIVIYKRIREGVPYDYIWRVVGLPGERVAIHGDTVLVNGHELPRVWRRQQDGLEIFTETADGRAYEIALPIVPDEKSELTEIEVPRGHLFALGDNRHNAADCRVSGPLPFEAIIAKAIR
jgi:signal peptidase I